MKTNPVFLAECPKCGEVYCHLVWWKTVYLPEKNYGYALVKSVVSRYECENGHRFTLKRKG